MTDSSSEIAMSLSEASADLLMEALDAYEYWQLGDILPRNNGEVFIPGDLPAGEDRYWDGQEITEEETAAIAAVRECRELRDWIWALRFGTHRGP